MVVGMVGPQRPDHEGKIFSGVGRTTRVAGNLRLHINSPSRSRHGKKEAKHKDRWKQRERWKKGFMMGTLQQFGNKQMR